MKQNKNLIIGMGAVLVIFVGIVWLSSPAPSVNSQAESGEPGLFTAFEKMFDFGTISMAAGKVSHSFSIRNEGNAPVTIKKIYTSCMCTSADLILKGKRFGPFGMVGHGFVPSINKILDAGEEASVEVTFDPAAHGPAGVGPIQREVTIENSAGEPLVLEIEALVTP